MLIEPNSPQERDYLAVIARNRRAIEAGQPAPLEAMQADLTTILDLPNNPHFHRLKALIEEGDASGPAVPLDIEHIKSKGRERRAARRKQD